MSKTADRVLVASATTLTVGLLATAVWAQGTDLNPSAGIPITTPQGTVTIPDATVHWLCGDDGAWIKYLIAKMGSYSDDLLYLLGLLGLHLSASVVSNFKTSPVVSMVVNLLALKLKNLGPPPQGASTSKGSAP